MSIKVAIASTDGRMIDQHFGKTNGFLIFQVNGPEDYELMELRKDKPSCSSLQEDGQK